MANLSEISTVELQAELARRQSAPSEGVTPGFDFSREDPDFLELQAEDLARPRFAPAETDELAAERKRQAFALEGGFGPAEQVLARDQVRPLFQVELGEPEILNPTFTTQVGEPQILQSDDLQARGRRALEVLKERQRERQTGVFPKNNFLEGLLEDEDPLKF